MGDHTESIQIDFDPSIITYAKLLEVFWRSHSTTHPSWGGKQYMSAIWYSGEEQKKLANFSFEETQKGLGCQVFTKVLELSFWTNAEDYHQKYYLRKKKKLVNLLNFKTEEELRDSEIACKLNGFVSKRNFLYNDFLLECEKWDLDSNIKDSLKKEMENILI
eukprot:TRINITY_DN5345_c0_g1_i1.p1 TRINITY_DN5345_c0_g1~~TRINITY_DN5345_c0_g1_i1.p1  ORF type:complete len:162 (-),score=52.60 TRINITY_DN5345_c0_g1_i1:48-533(-)